MQRKPGYPVANCSIKMPDNGPTSEAMDEEESPQRRQQLINFGHSQWGFSNWSWAVSKQDLDFVDLSCGKYTAGVAAFVSVTLKTIEIHRENVGYGTATAHSKGLAIHRARKCAVTNALRETLLSFGGSVASELLELDSHRELAPEPQHENNKNIANKPLPAAPPSSLAPPAPPAEPIANPIPKNARKDDVTLRPPVKNAPSAPVGPPAPLAPPAPGAPPVAKALPMPANLPPAANRPPLIRAPPPAPHPAPHLAPHPAQHPAPHPVPHPAPHPAPHPRPNSNEARGDDAEARAERKRRQRLAQEEFRLKQLQRQGQEEKQELDSISTSVDNLLMAIPTQVVNTNKTGNIEASAKRKSPVFEGGAAKRKALDRLD